MYDNVFRFQFHKGTIRTNLSFDNNTTMELFQFHKGTIRTWPHGTSIEDDENFNSIKVQLELLVKSFSKLSIADFNSIKVQLERGEEIERAKQVAFQFHKGTIRTHKQNLKFKI